jgi:oligoribonuclease NrnB/cAMP/cGMP phosphodiesterase (DHH superfamily)
MREQAAAGLVSSHPVRYGDELPEIPEDGTVFLLDFSLKAEAFHLLVERTKRVVVLDHHKTALAELSFPENTFKHRPLNDRPDIFIDVNKSGGRLAWEYFFPSEPSPFLVDYTEDRDLW